MKTPLRVFALALLLSVLVHLTMLGSGLLPDAVIELPPDQALRKIDVKMQALALDTPAPPAVPTARLRPVGPAGGAVTHHPAARKHKRKRDASGAQARTDTVADKAAEHPAELADASQPATESSKRAEASMPEAEPPASKPEEHAKAAEASAPGASNNDRPAGYLTPASALHRFPARAKLGYQTFYNGAMVGSGGLDWQQDGHRYTLEIRFNPLVGGNRRYLSQGQLGKQGLQPDSLQAWVGQDAKESARFDWSAGMLHFGDQGDKEVALRSGAQDVFSLAFQLGLKGGQLGTAPLQITTGKKVYDYPMTPSGETDYDTGSGKIRVIVFRAKGEDDITEFWLAPDFSNLPVRISRIDKSKRVELRAVLINVDGTEQWRLPARPMTRNNR
ncbi:DUF3108 domain-containing protein [Aquitalea sp. USM4]|uniref:DUF3108 domain-containing protein n=1 Tax=Aquitalea sp. USM4 TaxID=1590041 RepID=UPI00103DE5E2|nr:DUF3108 domain-containing protein [Aquitalea sp. USM4]QBJ78655.1 DUF3108 domain-containing protein [Aquitalea sp. USM4]